ncbi:MAG: radical SAM family heme chaperone HemW [Kiritimatiellia bacterium]
MPAHADPGPIHGVYLHVPFCAGKCAYCAFYSERYTRTTAERWLAALAREIDPWRGIHPQTIYIGGGTPSILAPDLLERLSGLLRETFQLSPRYEWTVEANPGSLTPDAARSLARQGVNRISLGAQSFHDRELRLLNRPHNATDIRQAVDTIRGAGIDNFNLDLLAGIPGGTAATWRNTLEQAVALQPAHVSVYALTLEENTHLMQMAGTLQIEPADDERQLLELQLAEDLLGRAGYERYEISNYARPGRACRHNLDCWRGRRYLGFGPAAAGHIGMSRYQNAPDLTAYLEALEAGRGPPSETELLTPELKLMEKMVFGLRMRGGVNAALVRRARAEQTMQHLAQEGLTLYAGHRWMLTARGRELADYVARELMS